MLKVGKLAKSPEDYEPLNETQPTRKVDTTLGIRSVTLEEYNYVGLTLQLVRRYVAVCNKTNQII